MCGRYVQTKRARDRARILQLVREEEVRRAESWNVAPTSLALAVRALAEGRVAEWLTWGLQSDRPDRPATDEASPLRPINARIESVAEKPFFRDAWKTRRCVIPADGWYEWKAEADLPLSHKRRRAAARTGIRKQPYYFHRRDGEPLFLAALWTADTYSLITTSADGGLTQIHDRRPLTLRDDQAATWLANEPASPEEVLAATIPPGAIDFHPVSSQVSNARQDGPDLIAPIVLDSTSEFLPGF
jgi:putative SOS response-associated peptidase YedK